MPSLSIRVDTPEGKKLSRIRVGDRNIGRVFMNLVKFFLGILKNFELAVVVINMVVIAFAGYALGVVMMSSVSYIFSTDMNDYFVMSRGVYNYGINAHAFQPNHIFAGLFCYPVIQFISIFFVVWCVRKYCDVQDRELKRKAEKRSQEYDRMFDKIDHALFSFFAVLVYLCVDMFVILNGIGSWVEMLGVIILVMAKFGVLYYYFYALWVINEGSEDLSLKILLENIKKIDGHGKYLFDTLCIYAGLNVPLYLNFSKVEGLSGYVLFIILFVVVGIVFYVYYRYMLIGYNILGSNLFLLYKDLRSVDKR
jgi:large-conductance mechanosensitive channel